MHCGTTQTPSCAINTLCPGLSPIRYHAPVVPSVRPMHAAHLMLKAKRWLQQAMPFWDRRGGRDHIWLMAHDEGACYCPNEIFKTSILLTHWGRLDLNHTSGTAYMHDSYSSSRAGKNAEERAGVKRNQCLDPCMTCPVVLGNINCLSQALWAQL